MRLSSSHRDSPEWNLKIFCEIYDFASVRTGIFHFFYFEKLLANSFAKNLITGTKFFFKIFNAQPQKQTKCRVCGLKRAGTHYFFIKPVAHSSCRKSKIISLMIKQHTTWVRKMACLWFSFAKIPLRYRKEDCRGSCGRSRFPPVDGEQSLSSTLFSAQKFITGSSRKSRDIGCDGSGGGGVSMTF